MRASWGELMTRDYRTMGDPGERSLHGDLLDDVEWAEGYSDSALWFAGIARGNRLR